MGKKKHDEHFNHEAWIIPYADMVTLLFAFFVVMYALSLSDTEKMEQVSESMSDAFAGIEGGADRSQQLSLLGLDGSPPNNKKFVVKKAITNQEIIDELRETLEVVGFDVVFQNEAQPINFWIDERGVVISVSAGYLFEPSSTEIPPDLYPVVQIIADVLKTNKRLINVEGHTDSSPTAGSLYYDDWDLSALRATATVRLLSDEFGIEANRMTASGLSRFRPVADNATAEGRAQNRRVDIILLDAKTEKDLLSNVEPVPGLK